MGTLSLWCDRFFLFLFIVIVFSFQEGTYSAGFISALQNCKPQRWFIQLLNGSLGMNTKSVVWL